MWSRLLALALLLLPADAIPAAPRYRVRAVRPWIFHRSVEQTTHWRIKIWSCAWLSRGCDAMTIFDYIAIGALIVLLVWVVAEHFPRGRL